MRALKGRRFKLFTEMVAGTDVLDLGTNTLNNSAIIPGSRSVQSVCAVESPK